MKFKFCIETVFLIMFNLVLIGMIADQVTSQGEGTVTTQVDLLFHRR